MSKTNKAMTPWAERRLAEQAAQAAAKTLMATSAESRGRDCIVTAMLVHQLLEDMGVQARVAIGYAAWRVGQDAAATVVHHPAHSFASGKKPGSFAGHAWVVTPNFVVDASTWTWQIKLDDAKAIDGMDARLEWPHEALVLPRKKNQSLERVVQGYTFAAFYEETKQFAQILSDNLQEPLDEWLVQAARLVLATPHANVTGGASGLPLSA